MNEPNKSDLMSITQLKETPVDYLSSILIAKQELVEGTPESKVRLREKLEELEVIARRDRIGFLQLYLMYVVSRMLYIQGELAMMEFTYSDIFYNLRRIRTYNRLDRDDDDFYIPPDGWQTHFDAVLPQAEELASQACMSNECRGWSRIYDRDLLWSDTKQVLSVTYRLNEEELNLYLRHLWSHYKFLPY